MSIRSKPTRPVTASLLQAAPIPQTSPLSVAADRAGMDIAFPIAMTCIVLVAIDLRPGIVSTGPILPLIREEFGLSHTIASLLTAIPDLLMGALALPTPWLARRLGRDRVILGALALLFAATLGRAFAPSTAWLLLATAGVGAGIAVAGALIAGFIKASFPARAAFAMGIYATALSLGSTVSAAITGPIAATTGGWRVASGLWSVLGIVALSAWFFVARHDRPERLSRTSSKRFPLPVGNRTAWLVALFFACQNFLFYACITWLAPLFREDGFGATSSGLVLASFTVAFTLANPVFGALKIAKSKHVGRQRRLSLQYTGRELWHAVEARLQSPVRKVREVKGRLPDEVAPLAGESALAHYTMLSEPRIARRALAAARWKHITGQFGLAPATPFDHDRVEIETWSYDPHVLARQPAVDRLSLYLSVRHDPDERVAQAAAQLLETFEW